MSKEVALSYEGACHRCGNPGHRAKNCPKPRICAKCGMGGHVEKFCGMRQMTTKEKLLAKYSQVCHRCGQKGHMSRECSVTNNFKCRICGEDHRISECPQNGASLANMVKNRRFEVSEFAKQKVMTEMMDKERRMLNAKEAGGTGGFGAVGGASGDGGGEDGGGAGGGGKESGSGGGAAGGSGVAQLCQPVIQVKKKEKTGMPQFKFAPKEKPKPGLKLPAPNLGADEPTAKKAKTAAGGGAGGGDDSDGSEGGLGGLLGDYGDSSGSEDGDKSDSDGDGDEGAGKVKSFF